MTGTTRVRSRYPRRGLPGIAVLAGALAGGCESPPPREASSDPIRITVPELGEATRCTRTGTPPVDWTIERTPFLEVYGTEADPLFRVTDALLRGSDLLVLNAGSEVLRFSHAGTRLQSFGGSGEGPGEFAFATDIERFRGDSLVVYDSELQRITVLSDEFELGRVTRLAEPVANPRFVGALADGGVVVRGTDLYFGRPWTRDSAFVVAYDPTGDLRASAPRLPHTISFTVDSRVGQAPFSSQVWYSLRDGLVVMGAADRAAFLLWDPDSGRLERVPFACDRLPLAEEAIEGYKADRLRRMSPEQRGEWRSFLDRIPFGDSLPVFQGMQTDGEYLWLGAYRGTGAQPQDWIIVDFDGRVFGTVSFPADMFLLQVGEDFVLGLKRDEIRGESVVAHRLWRTPSS